MKEYTMKDIKAIRKALQEFADKMDDETAIKMPMFFKKIKNDGSTIKAGERINWNGSLKRAKENLVDKENNNPDNNPELWETVNI